MYASAFDMDTNRKQELYPGQSWNNGYTEIGRILSDHGFERQHGRVYFGEADVTAVTCVLAIQDVSRTLQWFAPSVNDVRMLRIEEFNDLGPALETASTA